MTGCIVAQAMGPPRVRPNIVVTSNSRNIPRFAGCLIAGLDMPTPQGTLVPWSFRAASISLRQK